MKPANFAAVVMLCLSGSILSGCSSSFDPADSAPAVIPGVAISGTSFGGRQPVASAHVYLMRANTSSYAGPNIAPVAGNLANSLLTSGSGSDSVGEYVLTDANGKFSVSSDYTCTAGDQIYLLSLGGNPGGGANTAVGLMAILGTCGTDFSSATTVNMNEVSTIAAAYSIAGFASDATHVGITNSTNALTGLKNAFANAKQLFDISTNPDNTPNTTARTTTPGSGTNGGTGTVPQQQIDTLADILAMCVNSSQGSTQCTNLFSAGKSLLGVTPSDTATEAIFMAQNQHNISVYNITGTPPYTPYYNAAAEPADLSIQLQFTGGGLAVQADSSMPQGMEADASGNIWLVNPVSNVLSEFNHLGVPVLASGFSSGLNVPAALAIDATSANIWIPNFSDSNVLKYSISGNSTTAITNAVISGPSTVAIDGSGNILVNDYNNSSLYKITASNNSVGTPVTNNISSPFANAIGTNGYIWVANENGGGGYPIELFNNTPTFLTGGYDTINTHPLYQTVATRVDSSNNGWFLIQQDGYIVKATYSSGTLSYSNVAWSGNGLNPISLAIDGNNNLWVASSLNSISPGTSNNAVIEITSGGTVLTGATGYVPSPVTAEPDSLAVDSSGNVWYDSNSDTVLREMIGAAVPVDVPLAHAVANSKLGSRP